MTQNPNPEQDKIVIRVPGNIVSTSAEAIRREADALFINPEASWGVLELDARDATMVDSVGLNLLVYCLKKARQRGKTMRVRATSSNVVRALHATRLDEHLVISEETPAATDN